MKSKFYTPLSRQRSSHVHIYNRLYLLCMYKSAVPVGYFFCFSGTVILQRLPRLIHHEFNHRNKKNKQKKLQKPIQCVGNHHTEVHYDCVEPLSAIFKPLCPSNQKKSLFQSLIQTVITTLATQALGTFQKNLRLPFGFCLFSVGTSHFVPVPL